MTLDDWLKLHDRTPSWLARQIGVDQATASRYVRGQRMPTPENMRRIHDVTGGAVTPNDFYGVGASESSVLAR